jgi:glycosyltransferase involved in cell wall biosynthesis
MFKAATSQADTRLRVLLVITRGEPGGAQIHVLDLISGLMDAIHFQVVVGDDVFLSRALRDVGIPVHILPELQRSVSPITDFKAFSALRRLIKTTAPHLVHTHSSKAGLLGRMAAQAEAIPAIHTAHAWSFSDGLSWQRKAFAIPTEALAGRWTRRFIVVSEADREIGLRYHVARPPQVRVVHNGVADSPLRAQPEVAQTPVISMVARMAAPKDHLLLLKALSGIQAPFQLRLIGDGPDRSLLERAVQELGLQSKVVFVGVSHEVPALLASSHLFALVSKQEGFPLSILEAMRAGLPVVASNVGGIREAVIHEKTGFLVDRNDEAGLRTALHRLIVDPSLRRTLGETGRRNYEAQFTVSHMLTATLDVYHELALNEGYPLPQQRPLQRSAS